MTRARILADYVSSSDELALKAPLASPTLVTPALGTPTSGVMTNMTGAVTASLVDDAVTLAKMAHGADGSLITYSASTVPELVAPGTTGHVLTSRGNASTPTFQAAAGGGITHASQWKLASPNIAGDITAVEASAVSSPTGFGVLGSVMVKDPSSHIFTFPDEGYWWIKFQVGGYSDNAVGYISNIIETTHNNGTFAVAGPGAVHDFAATGDRCTIAQDYIFKVEDKDNYKIRFVVDNQDVGNLVLHTVTAMTFIRLGDI